MTNCEERETHTRGAIVHFILRQVQDPYVNICFLKRIDRVF